MFICTKCRRRARLSEADYPITCCGVRHEFPLGHSPDPPGISRRQVKQKTATAPPQESHADCVHRGVELRQEECATCCGKTTLKVFECSKHGECTIGARNGKGRLPEITCCADCGDYERPPYALSDITICVTSFLRFECLRRFVTSARYFYPGLPIIVADQSGDKATGEDCEFCRNAPNVTWLEMPFDAGISASRNSAVQKAKTRLICLLDDDHVFMDESRLESLLDVLNSDRSLSLVCGVLRMDNGVGNNGKTAAGWFADFSIQGKNLHHFPPAKPMQKTPAGTRYKKVDRYINCFLAPRSVLLSAPWHHSHKIAHEHLDHCLLMWKAGFKAAYSPDCIFGELHQESAEYSGFRNRRSRSMELIQLGLTHQTGSQNMTAEPGVADRQTAVPSAEPPCIVMLTVGHTGSTVIAGLFGALGWHLPDNDPEFNEPYRIREAGVDWQRCGAPIPGEGLLKDLPRPWIIKDPAFCETMEQWLAFFAEYKPLLLWLERDEQAVRASWARRGNSIGFLESRLAVVQKHFDYWPWAKMRLSYERIGEWAAAWKRDPASITLLS